TPICAASHASVRFRAWRLAELDEWAYGLAKKFAPQEDANGKAYWENDGDEMRFLRFIAFSMKCALGRAQFESPKYSAVAPANQEGDNRMGRNCWLSGSA